MHDDHWRHTNFGRVLNNAIRRFETKVAEILNEAGYAHIRLSHISLTRNLDIGGTRITELARRAAMTKQAMSELARQCETLGLVSFAVDPNDGRAKIVTFTDQGLQWLGAFENAIKQAEAEVSEELGILRLDALKQALTYYGREFDPLNLG